MKRTKFGESIKNKTRKMGRLHNINMKLREINVELLKACKLALPHHMGGHSEVGFAIKNAIIEAEKALEDPDYEYDHMNTLRQDL